MRTDIITPAEADSFLTSYPDWTALSEAEKIENIKRASYYTQGKWYCTDVDFDDDTTIPDEVKEAVAHYALANSVGKLFGVVTDDEIETGKLKADFGKVGDLAYKEEYYKEKNYKGTNEPFGYPDFLMSQFCNLISNGYLERV